MDKVLILTDIHITDGKKIIGLDPSERLRTALGQAARDHSDAAHLILMGDLVHFGSSKEYARLRGILTDLPWPVTLMIGNHDNRTKFRAAFPEADFTDCGYVQTAIQRPGWRLLCLDTVDDPAATGIPHAGYLCEDRLNWLKDALEDAGDDNVVVLTHHHPYLTGFNGMDNINLKNGDALLDLLKQYPNVRHLISGHVHRTIMGSVNGLAVAILKSTCHQMPMMLGQDGSSHSVDEPGAFGILLLGNGSAILHTEDVGLNGISGNDGHS